MRCPSAVDSKLASNGAQYCATATNHCGSDNAARWRISSSMAVLLTP
jgi:hypothetical protein